MNSFREIGAALVALADAGVDTLALATVANLAAAIIDKVDDLSPETPVEDIRAIMTLVETLESALDKLALAVAPVPTTVNTIADGAAA
jgi:hypothetical protein